MAVNQALLQQATTCFQQLEDNAAAGEKFAEWVAAYGRDKAEATALKAAIDHPLLRQAIDVFEQLENDYDTAQGFNLWVKAYKQYQADSQRQMMEILSFIVGFRLGFDRDNEPSETAREYQLLMALKEKGFDEQYIEFGLSIKEEDAKNIIVATENAARE